MALISFSQLKQIAVSFLWVSLVGSSASAQESILGLWNTGDQNTIIEIKELDGDNEGFIYSSDNEKAKKGTLVIKELEADGEVYTGKLYAIRRQQWVDATFERKDSELIINISVGFFSKEIQWEVVN